jgi:hypothetical protein
MTAVVKNKVSIKDQLTNSEKKLINNVMRYKRLKPGHHNLNRLLQEPEINGNKKLRTKILSKVSSCDITLSSFIQPAMLIMFKHDVEKYATSNEA